MSFESVQRRLNKLANLKRGMTDAAHKAGREIQKIQQIYPPPKPTYSRTFELRSKFSFRVANRGDRIIITNFNRGAVSPSGVRYEEFVKDPDKQAYFHQGWWATTDFDFLTVEEKIPPIMFEPAMEALR